MNWAILIIALLILLLVAIFIFKHLKRLHFNNVVLFTGGVKSGKTTLAVYSACKQYKRNLRSFKFKKWLCKKFKKVKMFKKWDNLEKPLLYSNIPLAVPFGYVPFTNDLINRLERFNYGSVCLLSEASLIADSFDYKDKVFNENLKLFCKLFAHETKGGYLFLETQSLSDLHYNFKRVNNSLYWILYKIKIPFFVLFRVKEVAVNDSDVNVATLIDNDTDKNKFVIVPKKTWQKFDCYTYSILTDNLKRETNLVIKNKNDSLKTSDIITIKGVNYYEQKK